MQQRVILLFLLFVVLAAFYASLSSDAVPVLTQRQRAQTELFNQLDHNTLEREESGSESSGD